MAEHDAIVLYWTKTGNTKKAAEAIKGGLDDAGLSSRIEEITENSIISYLDYKLIFIGCPVYSNLPPAPVTSFLKSNGRGSVPSAPEIPGHVAVPFCTYGGGHTGYGEADPCLKYMGQFFEHSGIRVADYWATPGVFIDVQDQTYNEVGRLGDIRARPSEQDLLELRGKTAGLLRRLKLVLDLPQSVQ